jgi:predicted translation initiation factor SUI1
MAKKPRDAAPPDQPQVLTHNPFAALSSAKLAVPKATPAAPPPATPLAPKAVAAPKAVENKPGKSRGRVVLRRETKHRGGKAVVIVSGLAALKDHDAAATVALAQRLKKQLGCGGTVEDGEIVLQGDRPAQVAAILRDMGFRVDGVTS